MGGWDCIHQGRRKTKPVIKSEDYIIIWVIKGHILFISFLSDTVVLIVSLFEGLQ